MGDQEVHRDTDSRQLRMFMKHALNDLRALEKMLEDGMFESGIRRIGAEQEVFLVDKTWHPACVASEILEKLNDNYYTTELGLFNLEFNLDPMVYGGNCLRRMENQINELMDKLRIAAAENKPKTEVTLVGILPTLNKAHLTLDNMTPYPRYFALNEAMNRLRGSAYQLQIRGKDELIVRQDSIMGEACNASFQVHFQVGADEFAKLYNVAQAITGPVLAAAPNSPILFGRRLWKESRIAVFQQAIDTRNPSHQLRHKSPRVSFGECWVRNSVVELFREDVSRFRALLGKGLDEDPFAKLAQGIPPELQALRLHSGTIYRWNRACYGISDGKPHLRIEQRALPSGPTPIDEVANAAFFFGLMSGVSSEYEDITKIMDFDDAKANFLAASRHGLDAQFTWLNGERITAQKLIQRLVPLAREGLKSNNIDAEDIDRYLGVIEERVSTGMTGAQWMLTSQSRLQKKGNRNQVLAALTAAMTDRQKTGEPVHKWALAELSEAGAWKNNYMYVENFMTTDLFSVHMDDLIDLAANLMDWNRLHHIAVEDDEGRLTGLVSYRRIFRHYFRSSLEEKNSTTPISSIMKEKIITVTPETTTIEAIELMRQNEIPCLPVVKDDRLVGMVTERDFMAVAGELLERKLREE